MLPGRRRVRLALLARTQAERHIARLLRLSVSFASLLMARTAASCGFALCCSTAERGAAEKSLNVGGMKRALCSGHQVPDLLDLIRPLSPSRCFIELVVVDVLLHDPQNALGKRLF